MASYLQIENISKSYGPKVLFENIGFNINEGDKIALIAPNGTGKTSLMRILAGKDKSDSGGRIMFLRQIRIAFLEQEYAFDPSKTVFRQIMDASSDFTESLDDDRLFEYELRVTRILTDFSLSGESIMGDLSGGEVKRVALTQMLASEADFFIMDEPTNHLDTDAIEYLESYLSHSRCTLFLVTHDRYFLDRVCNTVMELDHGAVYIYKGDYENYLVKRQERIDNYNAETDKVRNVLRRELEWIHATPCARTGKAKYRINAFHELKDRAEQVYSTKQVSIGPEVGQASRLGSKIINCKDVSFFYEGTCYLSHFTYNFQRYEKVGIVGRNGVGKSTFITLLTGDLSPTSGEIERGESLAVGYYRQEGMSFDESQTVLETVNDTRLLGQFLFTHDMLNNRISRLSGGEKRRLYLLTILMKQPNLLILDEPTNDLDIDRLVDHLFVFCGDGVVKDFIGGYSEYRSFMKDYEAAQKSAAEEQKKAAAARAVPAAEPKPARRRLTWKEQRELEQLEKDMEALNAEKDGIEALLSSGSASVDEITAASARFGEVKDLLDEKELRWLELSEIANG